MLKYLKKYQYINDINIDYDNLRLKGQSIWTNTILKKYGYEHIENKEAISDIKINLDHIIFNINGLINLDVNLLDATFKAKIDDSTELEYNVNKTKITYVKFINKIEF